MKKLLPLFFCFVLTSSTAVAQQATPSPTPPDDDVVRISTNLIQVDAVVTDKNGKQVIDLKAEDFEILQNGSKQEITNFSYITVASPTTEAAKETGKATSNDKPLPPVPTRLKAEQVRRTIALVVDDLGLSFESMHFVRQALRKFVDEQMQPNDLVAIVRTGGGIGALQQFTSDKRQLYAAIEKVRWNPQGRSGIGAFAPIQASPSEAIANATGDEDAAERARQERQSERNFDNFRTDVFSVGTLGALNFTIKGMRELPGRKAVVLLSDGFRLSYRDEDGNIDTTAGQRVLDSLRQLTDLANRSSVVVNTIDARGLQTLGFSAEDNLSGLNAQQIEQRFSDRRSELFDTQEGLTYLAAQTGGRSFINNNDIKGSVEKVLDDQKGYYLLGYEPDDATFDPTNRQFNRLTIKVKRPDLKIRYRSGFFGVADAEARPAKQTPEQQIFAALTSPFGANGVNLRLNALFGNDAKSGSFIRSLLHIQASDLKFTDEPDGSKKAIFDILAYTFGDNGVPIDNESKTYTMTVKKEDYSQIIEKGIVYTVYVPVKKHGAYQLRVALRDKQGEKIGAANQFIEVPNLKKQRLTLSSLVVQGMSFDQYQAQMQGQTNKNPNETDSINDTALRRFKRDSVLQYGYSIYNAKTAGTGATQATTQVRLFKEGKLVFESKPSPLNLAGQTDLQRISFGSAISLPKTMELGDYILQVVVTDPLAKEKYRTASQWVEFELTN
jgi:VWFA-related protein